MARILVVDDDPQVLRLTADLLTREGHDVTQAANPLQAMNLMAASSAAIDLMLIDAVMPTMSGPEFAEQMMMRYPGIKILFMTGLDALSVTLAYGKACESIQKPFQLHSLKTKVASMLSPS